MRLRVENPRIIVRGIDLPRRVVRLDQVAVLEDLGEPEALLEVVEAAAAGRVDVVDGAVPHAGAARRVDGQERVPRPVLVLGVARRAVRVVEALDHLRPQHVAAGADPEPGRGVEALGVRGRPPLLLALAGSLLSCQ